MPKNKYFDALSTEEIILDYKPSEPEKSVRTNFKEEFYKGNTVSYSNNIEAIDSLKPSYMINGLNSVYTGIQDIKDNLIQNIDTASLYKGLKDSFYEDINSDTSIEIYKALEDTEKEVLSVKESYIKANYKDTSLTEDQYLAYDDMLIDKIKELEEKGKEGSINYFSIYVDCQINKLLSTYVDSIIGFVLGLNECLFETKEGELNLEYKDILTKLFDSLENINSYDRKKLEELLSKDLITKFLNEVYSKKEETIELVDKVSSLTIDSPFAEDFENLASNSIGSLLQYILEFGKTVELHSLYRADYLNTLKKKKNIKDIYKKL